MFGCFKINIHRIEVSQQRSENFGGKTTGCQPVILSYSINWSLRKVYISTIQNNIHWEYPKHTQLSSDKKTALNNTARHQNIQRLLNFRAMQRPQCLCFQN